MAAGGFSWYSLGCIADGGELPSDVVWAVPPTALTGDVVADTDGPSRSAKLNSFAVGAVVGCFTVEPQEPVPQVEAAPIGFSFTFANGSLNSSSTLTSGLGGRTGAGGYTYTGEGGLTGESFFFMLIAGGSGASGAGGSRCAAGGDDSYSCW